MGLEARLMKRFLKGIRSYGAEIRVGGFSGMLVETLILHYQSFLQVLDRASKWRPVIFLELEKPSGSQDSIAREFGSTLVLVDPVDPNRNLAPAVSTDNLCGFVPASHETRHTPPTRHY